jgi:hypothetical protein
MSQASRSPPTTLTDNLLPKRSDIEDPDMKRSSTSFEVECPPDDTSVGCLACIVLRFLACISLMLLLMMIALCYYNNSSTNEEEGSTSGSGAFSDNIGEYWGIIPFILFVVVASWFCLYLMDKTNANSEDTFLSWCWCCFCCTCFTESIDDDRCVCCNFCKESSDDDCCGDGDCSCHICIFCIFCEACDMCI